MARTHSTGEFRATRRRRQPSLLRAVLLGVFLTALILIGYGRFQQETAPSEQSFAAINVDERARPITPTVAPGQVSNIDFQLPDGSSRRYLLSVPESYNVFEPQLTPVLVAFHGKDVPPEDFLGYSLFASAVPSEAIVIMPAAVDGAWSGAPYSTVSVEQDLDFIDRVIERTNDEYRVDPLRIYAIGMSNGGGFVSQLHCHRSNTFAALALISGAYYQPVEHDCGQDISATLTVHGTQDRVIEYEGGQKFDTEYLGVEAYDQILARRHECQGEPEYYDLLPGQIIERFVHCLVPTEHLMVEGGKHRWPESVEEMEYIWQFLKAQSK